MANSNQDQINKSIQTKKIWQKPHFYLLDTANVEGGGVLSNRHEAGTSNGNHYLATVNGVKGSTTTNVYNNYVHS